jgi:RNA polymerase sigma factor (sigma-70 family)
MFISNLQKEVSYMTKNYVYRNCSSNDVPYKDPNKKIDETLIEDFRDNIETYSDLYNSLKDLNSLEVKIIYYKFEENMKDREIASVLGCSQQYVNRILQGAISVLKNDMEII